LTGPQGWLRHWWLRRTVRSRITLVVATATLLCLVLLAKFVSGLQGGLLTDAADTDLQARLDSASALVTQGRMPASAPGDITVRVLDRDGDPMDGGPSVPLDAHQVRTLQAGEAVLNTSEVPPVRWLGVVITTPDGSQRLVMAGAALVGYDRVQWLSFQWLLLVAVLGVAVAGVAAWFTVRASLRPVHRTRLAATALPPGQRLPVPEARDELRAMAEAINGLLARRDEARLRLQRFTGDAAHELRSPVASIRAQAEVAVLHPDAAFAQEVLTEVVTESERLSALIDDLLVLSRSDAGELPSAGPVDLALAAQAAVGRLAADGPSVRLRAPARSSSVWASAGELDLVLDNLLRNAVRHARAHVTVFVLPTAGGGARLLVDDDGGGVPEEHRSRVFDRFYRVHDDRGRATGGFGLGLALVAEVVRRRGGTVSVGESPDGGARFEARWPGLAGRTD
jgi:signal transduction histidine kinase